MQSIYQTGDMTILYALDGIPSWKIFPTCMAGKVVEKPCLAEPLVQFHLVGDAYPNRFLHGHCMKYGQSVKELTVVDHTSSQDDKRLTIETILRDRYGNLLKHVAVSDGITVRVHTEFENVTDQPVTLEMLSSFTLGGLTPFDAGDAAGNLILHRLQSVWSAEGRLESRPVEEYQLEPSWSRYGGRNVRFGQIGSMPVREYFPFVAVEDTVHGVLWGAQLAVASSWQMEVTRIDNGLSLSGGLADREFGHWMKTVHAGESFTTPEAILSVCRGDIDTLCSRLVLAQEAAPTADSEQLPVVFNEYCTTWGEPSVENIKKIAARLQGSGVKYLVIDCGWYRQEGIGWENCVGDWQYSKTLFPNGMQEAVDIIRAHGMIPGIWFELETVGSSAAAFHKTAHLLKRDGVPITTGARRFWDMQDPWVQEYLTARVIDFLKQYGFGYLKVDYNDNLGIGCDGAESQGEALRQKVLSSQDFFQKIRAALPELVIENCASGGHRLEPSMMGLCDMASFSDAHECVQIPVIAANVQRAILPWKSQIWAVLRKEDSIQRVYYSIANTLLGRMCLSGEIFDLSPRQWAVVQDGIAFYERAKPVIRHGVSKRYGPEQKSYTHLAGWQAVVRSWNGQALIVFHAFAQPPEAITLPVGGKITAFFGEEHIADCTAETLTFTGAKAFSGCAVLMELPAQSDVSK